MEGSMSQEMWAKARNLISTRASLALRSKESACKAGDLGSIPGPGGSPGKGNGYSLQYSCQKKKEEEDG